MGYRWRKTKSNKHILMETQDVAYKRFVYLRKIQEYRKEKRPIVFTDESYIDSAHVSGKGWSDDSNAGVAAPLSKGERLIFLHAGGEMGFVKNCLTMWRANIKTGDYHDNKFETITETDWKKICENVKKMEEKFIGVQSQLEDTIESFFIDLGAESSEEDNSDFSEDDIEDGNLSGIEELISMFISNLHPLLFMDNEEDNISLWNL
ncbi:hypothetical protein J6590_077011 [Homalodisca vitripennis]|nr:hypothetical protein J6590_077011 [Homalodisca vitripennis]